MSEKFFTHYSLDDVARLITVTNKEMFTTVFVYFDRKMNLTAPTETNLTKYLNEVMSSNTRVSTPIFLAGDEVLMMATFMMKSPISDYQHVRLLDHRFKLALKLPAEMDEDALRAMMMHMDSAKSMTRRLYAARIYRPQEVYMIMTRAAVRGQHHVLIVTQGRAVTVLLIHLHLAAIPNPFAFYTSNLSQHHISTPWIRLKIGFRGRLCLQALCTPGRASVADVPALQAQHVSCVIVHGQSKVTQGRKQMQKNRDKEKLTTTHKIEMLLPHATRALLVLRGKTFDRSLGPLAALRRALKAILAGHLETWRDSLSGMVMKREREREGERGDADLHAAFHEHVSFDHVVAALTVPKVGRNGQIKSGTCVVLEPSQQLFVDRDALHQHPRRFVLVQSLNLNLEGGNRLDHVQYCIGVRVETQPKGRRRRRYYRRRPSTAAAAGTWSGTLRLTHDTLDRPCRIPMPSKLRQAGADGEVPRDQQVVAPVPEEECYLSPDLTEAACTVRLPACPSATGDRSVFNMCWRDCVFHLAGYMLNGHPDGPSAEANIAISVQEIVFEEDLHDMDTFQVYRHMSPTETGFIGDVYVFRGQKLVALCSDRVYKTATPRRGATSVKKTAAAAAAAAGRHAAAVRAKAR
ncbi:Polyketide synthase [Colletotrichum higginsianum IMI 349063]|uniref:Polyketide synthase n=1 Tax=Colletotrichum higginsianum (strain IMI 349063) TaxID=759273 RepID=A0A1B7Y875_COLHI|nr:Polyketide synthase [Colletotrichum higginsianum IMI 349063]OBR08138.1 Polyketide synthase [Colletotrichum higginsianum IMI 349063]